MAGTAQFTVTESPDGNVICLSWLCTSDGSGNVTSPTVTQVGATSVWKYNSPFIGVIGQIRVKPGTSTNQPSNGFALTLPPASDSTIDFLGGLGSSCSNTTTIIDVPGTSTNKGSFAMFNDIVTPYATGVGATKQFTLSVYLWI